MKISVPRQDPFSLPYGEQQEKHLCRQYSAITCSVIESLECPREKQQLWWSRLGPGSTAGYFPPNNGVMSSSTRNEGLLMKEKLNCIEPPFPGNLVASQSDQKLQRLSQVTSTSFQGQCQDHKETDQNHSSSGDADAAREKLVDRRHTYPSWSDEEHCSRSSVLISECHCEHQSPDGACEIAPKPCMKLMCSFGGRIMARPIDGKLRYVGGETRIVSVCKGVSFAEFMLKMSQVYGSPLGLKYQLPDEDVYALISVSSDDDLQNMMEEYDKIGPSGGLGSRLRLFFFTKPADVEFAVSELEVDNRGSAFPDPRYVNAINGLQAKRQGNLAGEDTAVLRPSIAVSFTNGSGRTSCLEQVNEVIQCSAPSSPLSSERAVICKPSGLLDLSSENVNERLEGETDQDILCSFLSTPFNYQRHNSQLDLQFSQAMDSPRVSLPDGPNSRNGENLLGLRRVDSQSKFTRVPDHPNEYRSSLGTPLEHRHEVKYVCDKTSPRGDYQRGSQQHAVSLPSPQQPCRSHAQQNQHYHHQVHPNRPQQLYHHHHHHQQQQQQQHHHGYQQHDQRQQSRYPRNEGDAGRGEYSHQDVLQQPQSHQLSYHNLLQKAPVHDGCSWNAEHHGTPRSTQLATQMLHGPAPAPPYQMRSSQSSPWVGVYDHQGNCPCGLQHSQVHRGISVSIGEQTDTRWPPPFQSNQGVQKQALRGSSRFSANGIHGADAAGWQQANLPMLTGEVEHKEYVRQRPVLHERHSRDLEPTDRFRRNWSLQYAEPLGHHGETSQAHDRPESSMRCICASCVDNRRQQIDTAKGNSAQMDISDRTSDWSLHYADPLSYYGENLPSNDRPESSMQRMRASCQNNRRQQIDAAKGNSSCMAVSDHASNWSLPRKLLDLDGGRVSTTQKLFPRASALKHEKQTNFNERIFEIESGFCDPQSPGDPDSRMPVAAHVDRSRKMQLSSGAITDSFEAADEPMPKAAEWSSNLAKNPSELATSRSIALSDPRYHPDVLFCQQGQQMRLAKDLPDSVIIGSLSGMSSFEKNGVLSDGNTGAAMSISFCGDKVSACARRVECDAVQGWAPIRGLGSGDQGGSTALLTEQGDSQFLSPDVSPLDPAVESGNSGQMVTSSVFGQSPFSSANMRKFSFVTGKAFARLPERILEKEPIALGTSATEELVDGLTSAVLDCCSDETLAFDKSDVDQVATYFLNKEGNVLKAKEDREMVSIEGNISKLQLGEGCEGSSMKCKALEDVMETVMDKAGATNGLLKAAATEDLGAMLAMLSDGSNTASYQEEAANDSRNEPSGSDAEAEAIARGLQIIKNSDLEDAKELGSGTYGTVYHGKWRGSDVAIKRIKASCFTGPPPERECLIADFWREACTLGQLHHPNVVAFYGVVPDGPGGTLATITEYMVNGSLKQVLHKKDRTIDRRKRLLIAMDAAFGMEYLHSKNIVHFDLKCENLLVNMRDTHRPICKVGDFGLSKVKHQTLVSGGVRGTLPWMAPELLNGNCGLVSEKVDVFSFGIVMWELLTGEEPYANMRCGAIIGGIANDSLRPTIPSWCDPGWRSLMEKCWCGNPADRPPFTEVAMELRVIAATMNLK